MHMIANINGSYRFDGCKANGSELIRLRPNVSHENGALFLRFLK